MKMHSVLKKMVLGFVLMAAAGVATADRQRTFGFFGEIDSFDRAGRLLVVDDHVFRLADDVHVFTKKGRKGVLSDIRPGVKVGFYPSGRGDGRHQIFINEIWVLPANWKAERGYSVQFDR